MAHMARNEGANRKKLRAIPQFIKCEELDSANFARFAGGAPTIMGIDEAGRGPVLGPMVYACAIAPVEREEELKRLGVDDSKSLTEGKREQIFSSIRETPELASYSLRIAHPRMISAQMYRRDKCTLNEISHNCAISLIASALDAGINVVKVYVDTVGPKDTYQAMLRARFPQIGEIVVSEKADSKFAIVSAASIVAKVTRDQLLADWKFCEQIATESFAEYGSGYPGDPLTKEFISKTVEPVFGYTSLVRFSWKTAESELAKHGIQCTWENETEKEGKNTLKQMWGRKERRLQHGPYFRERGISSVGSL